MRISFWRKAGIAAPARNAAHSQGWRLDGPWQVTCRFDNVIFGGQQGRIRQRLLFFFTLLNVDSSASLQNRLSRCELVPCAPNHRERGVWRKNGVALMPRLWFAC